MIGISGRDCDTSSRLIYVNGFRTVRTEPRGMGRGLKWDWLEIAGYGSLILAVLAVAMVLAF
jgi:hypothetical protein